MNKVVNKVVNKQGNESGRAPGTRVRLLKARAAGIVGLVVLGLGAAWAKAPLPDDEWPQWRGPHRNANATEFEPPGTWPPALLPVWQTEVGPGDASPVVSAGRVFVFSREGEDETVSALDLASGKALWRKEYSAPYKPLSVVGFHGAGPFSTPLVKDGRLYTYGISQILSAWSADGGELLWQRHLASDFANKRPFYGTSVSPLWAGGQVIVAAGGPNNGAIIAVDPSSGADLWRLAGDGPAYGSAVSANFAGSEQIVTLTQRRLVGLAAGTGELLWEVPYKVNFDNTALTPLVHEGLVIVSASDTPIRAFRPEVGAGGWSAEQVWENADASMDFSSPVIAAGKLVGFSVRNKGQLVLLDPSTGEMVWSGEGRQGENAFLIAVGETVLSVNTEGELQVLRISEKSAEVLRRYPLTESAVWTQPALLSHHLLIKDRGTVRLWEIPPG